MGLPLQVVIACFLIDRTGGCQPGLSVLGLVTTENILRPQLKKTSLWQSHTLHFHLLASAHVSGSPNYLPAVLSSLASALFHPWQSCHDLRNTQVPHSLNCAWVRSLTLHISKNIGLTVTTEFQTTTFKSLW